MNKELQKLQFVKKATTKQQTELAGSNTFYFSEKTVSAYNNIIGIQAKIDVDIVGSINADNFYQLINKLPDDIDIKNTEKKLTLKYGKSSASLQKDEDLLARYIEVVFPNKYNLQEVPSDFLEALSIANFQSYNNQLSGVFIDDDVYYAIDKIDIASYKTEQPIGETLWIPRDGVQLLLNMPEEITNYSVSSSFLYVFTENYTVAIKLKLTEQYPLKQVDKLLNQYSDYSHTITVPYEIKNTLDRIKLSTSKDSNEKFIFKLTTDEELIVENVSNNNHMTIKEHLDYEKHNIKKKSYIIPIDNFLNLLDTNTLHIVEGKGVSLASHSDKKTHLLNIMEA